MSETYRIKLRGGKKPVLYINPKTAGHLGLGSAKLTTLHFGSARRFASVFTSENIPENELHLTSRLIAGLQIPDYPDYELRTCRNGIIIGPFIGMLVTREDKKLTPDTLNKMKIYVSNYAGLHGAVVIFALNMVDPVGQLIEGYCFNPISKSFEKGVFPFPCAIYRTIGLNEHWKNLFLSVIGNKLYSSHYFNKWEMYQWYSKNPDLSAHVPFTCKYQSPEDVFLLLDKYNKVYIKPISGLGGHGVVQVRLRDHKYIFKFRENGENLTDIITNRDEAAEYLNIRLSHGKHLVQQPIELIRIKERVVDFRCVMQKNLSGDWECKAIIVRCSDKGSIVSNISSGGSAFVLKNKHPLPLHGDRAARLGKDIGEFALKVCNAIDQYGINCGTLGLDIGADINGKLWLIEINNRDPDPSIALDARDKQLYMDIKTGTLTYAKSLCGFA